MRFRPSPNPPPNRPRWKPPCLQPIPKPTFPTPGPSAVLMRTSAGDLTIELYPNEAPGTVANFLQYVEDGFYDGTIFHRVVRGFVIQGGGFTADMMEKETRAPIENEAAERSHEPEGHALDGADHGSAQCDLAVLHQHEGQRHAGSHGTHHEGMGLRRLRHGDLGDGDRGPNRGFPGGEPRRHNDVPETPIVIESATVVAR